MSGFERIKEQKKANIKTAAMDLFFERGLKDVKISDIAKKAGVSQVTIYNHFGGKKELLREVIKQYTEKKYSEYERLLVDDTLPFSELMEHIIFDKDKEYHRINPEILQEMFVKDEAIRLYVQKAYEEKTLPFMRAFVQKGKAEGHIHPDLSTESILFFLNMLRQGMDKHGEMFADPDNPIVQDLIHLFYYGLLGKQEGAGNQSGRDK